MFSNYVFISLIDNIRKSNLMFEIKYNDAINNDYKQFIIELNRSNKNGETKTNQHFLLHCFLLHLLLRLAAVLHHLPKVGIC